MATPISVVSEANKDEEKKEEVFVRREGANQDVYALRYGSDASSEKDYTPKIIETESTNQKGIDGEEHGS